MGGSVHPFLLHRSSVKLARDTFILHLTLSSHYGRGKGVGWSPVLSARYIPLLFSDTLALNYVSLRQHSLRVNSYVCIASDIAAQLSEKFQRRQCDFQSFSYEVLLIGNRKSSGEIFCRRWNFFNNIDNVFALFVDMIRILRLALS